MTVCPNCGCDRLEKYCPECGQENVPSTVPVRELLFDLLGDLFKVEARLWATLWPLISRPGLLTQEFLAGRRARYLTPLKLYLSVGFVYFLLFSWISAPLMKEASRLTLQRQPALLSAEKDARKEKFRLRFMKRFETAMNWQTTNQGTLNLYLIPVFAVSLAFVFRGQKRLYMEHVVFLLHAQSATYLLSLPLLPFLRSMALMSTVGLLPSIVYYPLAIRRVYGPMSWPKTLWISFANAILSLILMYTVMFVLFVAYLLWP